MRKVFALLFFAVLIVSTATADESGLWSVWVMCQPDSYVNVRDFPKTKAREAGYVELGQELKTDGVTRNGFLHIDGFEGGGWIYSGFVSTDPVTVAMVDTEIMSKGRVACRRYINGTRRKWLKRGEKVTVYAFAYDWAVTDQGFVQSKFLKGLAE